MATSKYVEYQIEKAAPAPAPDYEALAGRMAELLKDVIDLNVYLQDCGVTQFDNVDDKMERIELLAAQDIKAWRELIKAGR